MILVKPKLNRIFLGLALLVAFCNAANLGIYAHIALDHHHNSQSCPDEECSKCPICNQYFICGKVFITEAVDTYEFLEKYISSINYEYHFVVSSKIFNHRIRPPPILPFC